VRRTDLMHVVAAAADVTGDDEFVVIGSQAILASVDDPPESMLESMEADIYPRNDSGAADEIDGALGDGSPFHAAHGYYAHGVGPETAKPPRGWQDRLVGIGVPVHGGPMKGKMVTAWCLDPHDLVLSKLAAGRERDWEYATEALKAEIVRPQVLLERVRSLPLSDPERERIDKNLRATIGSM